MSAAGEGAPPPPGITRFEVHRVEPAAFGGRTFGKRGTYRKIVATAHGEVDPAHPGSALVTDLAFAPANERGRVEYASDVVLLTPTDPAHASGLLFCDIPNRGNRTLLDTLNHGVEDVNDPRDVGDGFAMEQGYTLLAHGWQGDVLPGEDRLRLRVPVARWADGTPITGLVRTEYVVSEPARSLTLSSGAFLDSGTHASYATVDLDPQAAKLTRRSRESDVRVEVPPTEWAFADCTDTPWPGRPSPVHLAVRDGFEPGAIYELVYTARDPLVLGLGYAATRDLVSFLRYADTDACGTPNPVGGVITSTAAFGSSQSGRFIRGFLHLGFNAYQHGRRVWDGVAPHVATGRSTINLRFGQPGRGYGQHEDHLFPQAESPTTWATALGYDGRVGSLLDRCTETDTRPLVVQTVSSTEYWQGRMSLTTTDLAGTIDLPIPPDVRVYFLTGTQHGPAEEPLLEVGRHPLNPTPHFETLRALLVALAEWVCDGTPPPPSAIPRLADQTLVPPDPATFGWPPIPGATYSGLVNRPLRLDPGPGFDARDLAGVVSVEPPVPSEVVGARVLVPRIDADGNEIAGVRSTSHAVPVATTTGWNIRASDPGAGDLAGLRGSWLAFPVSTAQRLTRGDPRASLEERYGDHAGYVAAVRDVAIRLVKERLLLPRDAERLVAEAESGDVLLRHDDEEVPGRDTIEG